MKISLAGYNVDADQLGYHINDNPQDMTPETISAAYARISRSPKPVDVLRQEAVQDVAKARKSNESIVFEMGHASVAEHAVFNFDIVDVSRLAIEAIEHSRLASYTERSQRYLRLQGLGEVHVPLELVKFHGFKALMLAQMESYQELRKDILKYLVDKAYQFGREGPSPAARQAFEGQAKEDARYVTALAVTGQLGMTINARNLETMVRRLLSHPLQEVQGIGRELHRQAVQVAPSLLRYCEPEPIRQLQFDSTPSISSRCSSQDRVRMVMGTLPDPDDSVLSAMMFQNSRGPFLLCAAAISEMSSQDKWRAFCGLYERMELHSAAPRAFELPDAIFELVGSASFFAQLKRHRMATILPQAYDVTLGCVVPKNIRKVGLARFEEIREQTEELHAKVCAAAGPQVAEYVLMQAHQRRVLVKMNARELYAFARLREDHHAQWEIREVAHQLIRQAREEMPMTLALACGKDEFVALKERLMGCDGYTIATAG
jgi:thymidylate synthase ThyX